VKDKLKELTEICTQTQDETFKFKMFCLPFCSMSSFLCLARTPKHQS